MNYIEAIKAYKPINEQEINDKRIVLDYINSFKNNVLSRDNKIAHITSSGFIMNETFDKVLFVHHNIINHWAWTGGHADGDKDLLYVALKEAKEETGIIDVKPLSDEISSIDILSVVPHVKNSKYINSHLHLSIAYILIADESEELKICKNENSAVKWLPIENITKEHFSEYDIYLYNKLTTKSIDIVSKNIKGYLKKFTKH